MRKYLFILILSLTLGGCANQPAMDKQQGFAPQLNTFVLLGSTQWDAKLRAELARKDFKVLKSAAKSDAESARGFDKAEARYGLTFKWVNIDHCVENSSKIIAATLEVSDIKTNDVLLVLKKTGFTGPCGPPRELVFEELANALADSWRRK